MGQCSPHVHFSPICLGKTIAWGITAIQGGISVFSTFMEGAGVEGIGQFALASNRSMKAGTVLGQEVSSLTCKVEALDGVVNGRIVLSLGSF